MKVRRTFWVLMLAGAVVWLPAQRAHAGAYQSTVVQDTGATGATTTLTKKPGADKIALAPSKKKGDGGVTIQLVAKDISCGSKCSNNVIDMGTRALGTDVPHSVGILFNVSSGQALFSNGKNKQGTGSLFGALSSVIFNQSLGIGLIKLREPPSDPAACGTVPLADTSPCIDGKVYAVAGFVVPVDPSKVCAIDAECVTITLVCNQTTHLCETQGCAADEDCNSGHCNINAGTCCDPNSATGCQ